MPRKPKAAKRRCWWHHWHAETREPRPRRYWRRCEKPDNVPHNIYHCCKCGAERIVE